MTLRDPMMDAPWTTRERDAPRRSGIHERTRLFATLLIGAILALVVLVAFLRTGLSLATLLVLIACALAWTITWLALRRRAP